MPTTLPFSISGTGSYLPVERLLSSTIDERYKRPNGKTQKRTGILQRPRVGSESSSFMAIAASKAALEAAQWPPDIDLIISACAVPEQPIPAMAPLIQAGLGLQNSGVFAFDVNASCLSFVTASEIAARYLETSGAKHVLIASSEIASRALPWDSDVDTAAMFGDGAAAAIISRNTTGKLVSSHMETWSSGYRDCELPSGGTRFDFHTQHQGFADGALFKMDGRAAYKLAAKVIGPFMERLLSKAGWTLSDIDLVIPHQASRSALDHLVTKLKIPKAKIVDVIVDHGNQIAASIPMALHQARTAGLLRAGKKILLVGTSAGFSVGGLCLEL
jgi:3-oxoacyl-[acyl-carrier-protein] synthase III